MNRDRIGFYVCERCGAKFCLSHNADHHQFIAHGTPQVIADQVVCELDNEMQSDLNRMEIEGKSEEEVFYADQ